MIKFENTVVPYAEQWRAVVMGARNPLNSWERSDSVFGEKFKLGQNDLNLLVRLRNAGTDHRKFMRMIPVHVDITAPLYWWKEFDTYKVGTVANSCSTMHKIHAKEFTMDDFSHEHLRVAAKGVLLNTIDALNAEREAFIGEGVEGLKGDKQCWYSMIQLLPTSYNQKRTVMLNYEVLTNIYHARKTHKLDEWHDLCRWVEALPYAKELILDGSN